MSVYEGEIVARRGPISYKDYSPERKAEVIALVDANNGNVKRTADEVGIHFSTIQYWIDHRERFKEIQPLKHIELVQRLDFCADLLVESIPEKIADASLAQVATAAGIMIDKSQLLKGLPTSITENVDRQELLVLISQAVSEATSTE